MLQLTNIQGDQNDSLKVGKFTDNINTRVQLEKGLKLRSGNDLFDLIV